VFDEVKGILRNQRDYGEALANMYLLGRYAEEADLLAAEEDNHAYYVLHGIVDATLASAGVCRRP
jgi:hypothetical protein